MFRPLAVLLSLVACTFAFVPASHAAGALSAASGVLYEDCGTHTYSYAVSPPAGTDSWSMTVVALGPDGTEAGSDFVHDDIATGTGDILLCGSELPGTYQLVADVEYSDHELGVGGVTAERLRTTFVMRLPQTATSLKVSDRTPAFNSRVRFVVKSRDERPAGFFGTSYATVRLQVKAPGRWVNIRGARTTTDAAGKATFVYRWDLRRPLLIRAVTTGSRDAVGSVSRPVRVRPVG